MLFSVKHPVQLCNLMYFLLFFLQSSIIIKTENAAMRKWDLEFAYFFVFMFTDLNLGLVAVCTQSLVTHSWLTIYNHTIFCPELIFIFIETSQKMIIFLIQWVPAGPSLRYTVVECASWPYQQRDQSEKCEILPNFLKYAC